MLNHIQKRKFDANILLGTAIDIVKENSLRSLIKRVHLNQWLRYYGSSAGTTLNLVL
jgi:hypothetical protein